MVGPGLRVNGGISTVEKLILKYAPTEVCIRHISTFEDGWRLTKVLVFLLGACKLLWTLLVFRPDVVHIHFSKRGSTARKWLLMILAKLFGRPVLLHAHSGDFAPFFSALPRVAQRLIAGVLRQCSGFVALSETWSEYYESELGIPKCSLRVLANPIEIPPLSGNFSSQQEGAVVVYLGRVSHAKGAFDLLQAYALIPPAVRQGTRLILAGDGETQRARQMARDLCQVSAVDVVEWLSPAERDELLRRADLFVLPSYYEGLPMSLLEAMANGVAVVASPVGGIPEIIRDWENGLLVPAGDVRQLADAIQALLQHPNYRASLGIRARASVAHLDVCYYMPQLVDMYRLCLRP